MRPTKQLTVGAACAALVWSVAACGPASRADSAPTTTAFDGLWNDEPVTDPSDYELDITFCGVNEMDLPKLPADPEAYLDRPYIVGGTAPPGEPDGRGYEIAAGDGILVTGTLTNRSDRRRRFDVSYNVVGTEMSISGVLFAGLGVMNPGETEHFFSQAASLDGPIGELVECQWSVRDHITDRLHPPEQ